MTKEDYLEKLAQIVIEGDEEAATRVSRELIEAGINPLQIQQGAVKGLDIIGERYQKLEAFLPELILAGDAMKACIQTITPHIKPNDADEVSLGKVVIGTVSGDVHDIGKNIVSAMLTASGFEVHDVGISVDNKDFLAKAEEVGADIIALSALLTTTSFYQKEFVEYLQEMGLREKYYVLVGGAPVTLDWAAEIGADSYAKNAIEACQVCKQLMKAVPAPLEKPIVVA